MGRGSTDSDYRKINLRNPLVNNKGIFLTVGIIGLKKLEKQENLSYNKNIKMLKKD